jgi:hypothetical protein
VAAVLPRDGSGPGGHAVTETPDPIEEYLDELLTRLVGPPSEVRRVLAESEAHLRDAVDNELATGASRSEAERAAIARFGSSSDVARAVNHASVPARTVSVLAALAAPAMRMVAAGLIAIGVSAALARVLAGLTSSNFVFGLPPGVIPAASRCAHWLSVQPTAKTCAQAAMYENADDTLQLYVGFAVLGLLLLALIGVVFVIVRRALARRVRGRRVGERGAFRAAPPPGVVEAIGTTVFGGVGLALLAAGLTNSASTGLWGHGLWYVEATVSLAIAAVYLILFVRSLASNHVDAVTA